MKIPGVSTQLQLSSSHQTLSPFFVCDSLLASGGQKAHHLHGQLKPLEVMLQVFSFHCEAVLQQSSTQKQSAPTAANKMRQHGCQKRLLTGHHEVRRVLNVLNVYTVLSKDAQNSFKVYFLQEVAASVQNE